jgi:hypothetical protein
MLLNRIIIHVIRVFQEELELIFVVLVEKADDFSHIGRIYSTVIFRFHIMLTGVCGPVLTSYSC